MSKSNCEPALLSSLETLQHNLQDAGMLRMKASLYSEAAVSEALGDSEYRRISEKLDRRALLAQLDAVSNADQLVVVPDGADTLVQTK